MAFPRIFRSVRRLRARWIAAAAVLSVLVFHHALLEWAVETAAGQATGTHIAAASSRIGPASATFSGVTVTSMSGEPIARIERLDLRYDLRRALDRRYIAGVERADVERPDISILRRADGTYDLPFSSNANGTGAFALILQGSVRDGTLTIADENGAHPPLRFDRIAADFDINTSASSRYNASLAYTENGRSYPISGGGTADAARHAMLQHWIAPALPVARIATFAADNAGFTMQAGTLRDVQAIYAGLPDERGAMDAHLAGTALLRGARIAIGSLSKPVRDVAGRLDFSDEAVTTQRVAARIGGTTMHFTGGIYDLTKPQLRIATIGSADLSELGALLGQPRLRGIRGSLSFSTLAVGAATDPTLFASARSSSVVYANAAATGIRALAAVDARQADVAGHARASGIAFFGSGNAAFAHQPLAVAALLHADAPSELLPSAGVLGIHMQLHADALAESSDPSHVRARGVVAGSGPNQSLAGVFDVAAPGAGTFGPLRLQTATGALYGRGSFDVAKRTYETLATVRRANDAGAILVRGDGTRVAVAARGTIGGGRVVAYGALAPGKTLGVAANGMNLGALGRVSFGAVVAGTALAPHANGAFTLANARFNQLPIDASAAFDARDAAVRLSGALASVDNALVALDGSVRNAANAPNYDVAMRVRGADVHALAQAVDPSMARILDGSADADVHLTGTPAAPHARGTFSVPEGSFNGQGYRSLSGAFDGTPAGIGVSGASVVVGSTQVAFSGGAGAGTEYVSLHAPAADLADFNDLFDRGDVLAGRGHLDLRLAAAGERITSSAGSARFDDARFLQFPLGATVASWHSSGNTLAIDGSAGGPSGRARIDGVVGLADESMNLRGSVRDADLAAWLPLADAAVLVAVTGRGDADLTARGRYPHLSMTARAALRDATAGGIPIRTLALAAHVRDGAGTIDSAQLRIPYLDAQAAGTFGLDQRAPLNVTIHATSSDVGQLAHTVTGKTYDAAGALDTTLAIGGSAAKPLLNDRFTLDAMRYGKLSVPHAAAQVAFDGRQISLRQGEVDFQKGRITARGAVPVVRRNGTFALGNGAVAADVGFDDVELSNFAALLPAKSVLSGRLDGDAGMNGTVASPQLRASVALANGNFSSPQEETPLTGMSATLAARGSSIDLHANGKAGSGTVDGFVRASAPSLLRARDLSFVAGATAHGATVDLPAYFKGQVDGSVSFAHAPGSLSRLSGDVAVSHARLPVSAFLTASGAPASSKPPDVALNLGLRAGTDVRVVSPNVDVGGEGSLRVAGTLDKPSVSGAIDATGGSVNFYRDFRLQRGRVSFDPGDGLIPHVSADATTFIGDPETNVHIGVTGPVADMQLALTSDPSYDRTQILALLAGAQNFGTIPGVAATSGSGFSATGQAENLAFGQADQMFTRELLDPLSANLGSALGLANLDLYSDVGQGYGFSAKQRLGDHLTATGSETLGVARRQDIEVAYRRSDATAIQMHVYQQQLIPFNPGVQQVSVGNQVFNVVQSTIPPIDGGGTAGISFSLQRRYW
jgi:TamB, inner membrane protein subunit of TAM complex